MSEGQIDIEVEFKRAKDSVTEIEVKRIDHQRKIDEREEEQRRLQTRSPEERLSERAAAYFGADDFNSNRREDLRTEFARLYDEQQLFDVEIRRRKGEVDKLRGHYSVHLWEAEFKARDLEIKRRMASALIDFAKACEDEVAMVEEILSVDARPTHEFRCMRPKFIGRPDDPNSFIPMWLRELKTYYPKVVK